MTAAAITDHGVMFGVIDFYKAARAAGIRPILGCEVYVAPNSRFDRETSHGEDRYYHLVLLAENHQGYQNLMKIVSTILGCEVYVAPNSRFDRETSHGEDRYYHLVLLAENHQGYQNLMKIVSTGFVEGYYYKPRVDMEILGRYHEGIIALSACLGGEVQRYLLRGLYEEAKEVAYRYEQCFGKGNFFLERCSAICCADYMRRQRR